MGWLEVDRADPNRARAGPKYHVSIFWAMGKGWKTEIWHADSLGHGKANEDGWRWSGPARTGPGLATGTTGPSSGPWGRVRRLKFGMQVVLAMGRPTYRQCSSQMWVRTKKPDLYPPKFIIRVPFGAP